MIVYVEDVNGSFARLVRESPKVFRRHMSTAVFQTAAAVERTMDATVPFGPEGEGLTPSEHIKLDIEHRGKTGSLSAQVGVFDNEDQVKVATYNEYRPNRQPFMRAAAEANSTLFLSHAKRALSLAEREMAQGF